jgi:catechol 2,3-dioxygenase-like lactoylglutathione lyase family enzyme
MSSPQVSSEGSVTDVGNVLVDMKLEVLIIPVSDIDRSKDFYSRLGWRLDADVVTGDDFRLIQFTPPGSGCSVQFGTNLTSAAPGSLQATYLIVSDIAAVRDELAKRGFEITDVFHCDTGFACRFGGAAAPGRVAGRGPDDGSYSSFASLSDPDGNSWLLQEVTTRLPGRVDPASTTFASTAALSEALQRAAAAHGRHEARTGEADPDWPRWYADYIVREQAGEELPT